MEVKEICGFLDSRNMFHKTKEEADISNSKIKIENIERALDNFSVTLSQYLFEERYRSGNHYNDSRYISDYVLEQIAKLILRDSDSFIAIINEKKRLEKELNIAKAEYDKQKYLNKWYYKLKWW